jgi:tetratricopeptide (TPR) repeat protein
LQESHSPATIEVTIVGQKTQSVTLAAILCLLSQIGGRIALPQSSQSVQNSGQDEKTLLREAEREPDSVQAVGALGEYYLRNGKWQQSVQWLTKAYALSGGVEAFGFDLAYALMQTGELDRAKREIDDMLSRTDSARLHNLLGEIDGMQADYVNAAREYHRAAEIDPSESNIFDLATFLVQHKKYVGFLDDSIKFFRYGVAQFPRSSRMMVGLGVALYAASEYDEAIRALCAAVDMDPKDPRPIQFLGRASKVSPGLAEEVNRRLKDFAERYPDNAATNYFYALGLWERGDREAGRRLDEIERLLHKAESLSPGWYEPHYQLGVLYEAEKQYPDAIREMNRAVKIDPDFFPAHFRLAVLYNKTGRRTEASAEASAVKRLKEKDNQDEPGHDISQ